MGKVAQPRSCLPLGEGLVQIKARDASIKDAQLAQNFEDCCSTCSSIPHCKVLCNENRKQYNNWRPLYTSSMTDLHYVATLATTAICKNLRALKGAGAEGAYTCMCTPQLLQAGRSLALFDATASFGGFYVANMAKGAEGFPFRFVPSSCFKELRLPGWTVACKPYLKLFEFVAAAAELQQSQMLETEQFAYSRV
eukprot:1158698-Pelagomonas_calceolata.AAC.5